MSTQLKHTAAYASSLSVRGGSFALPNTEVTVCGTSTQTSVDHCDGTGAGGYVVSMRTDAALTRGGSRERPFTSSTSLKATSSGLSEPSPNDNVDLPRGFRKLFGEWSILLLVVPLTILKLRSNGLASASLLTRALSVLLPY
jgi:hypothetical protein